MPSLNVTLAELLDGVKGRDNKDYVVNGKLQYAPDVQFSILGGESSESTVSRITEEFELRGFHYAVPEVRREGNGRRPHGVYVTISKKGNGVGKITIYSVFSDCIFSYACQ